ncbi:MFS transporter, DHA2 family, metal-tetracycline-proton antiporter [Gracilibacillus orientalis]|uniref:MFS transporter, DHA2 family, metal-tetracycline-proton antiporter n=1 Tax=Gracilibacillus orientalis TaxID=334253 RepID=A0A1I4K055_9BACI|nr:MFS transporter [Gracilibacillus orientalis]SFL72170.1 MFS transporter, DHA2 family, metal-tetracycline-proton antiporter [Gracilibacillus orientalis]
MVHEVKQQTGEKLMRILMFTLVLSVMSATVFNIVLPDIAMDLDLSFAQVSWVSSAYMLIYGIGAVVYGKLADTCKPKNLLTFGLIFFSLGSMVGLIAQAYWMVLLGRILQAVGASVIPAMVMIIPARYFPPERRGRALGMVAVGLALGRVLGPIVSALIVSIADWRWLFCLPLFSLFLLPFYRKYMDDEQGYGSKVDWIGGGLFAGTIALLLLSVTKGGWMLAICCLILFVLFMVRIRSAAEPFVQARLFQNKRYSLGLLITFLVSGSSFSFVYLSPLLLSDVNHLDPQLIGMVMVPAAIIAAILGKKGGKLADAKGNPFLFYLSTVLMLIAFLLLSSFVGSSPIFIAVFLTIGDVGAAFILITLSNTISQTLPNEQIGVGMGIFSMLNFMAGSIAGAVYGKVVDLGAVVNWNPVNLFSDGFVYSNIYLSLALLLVSIILLYYFQFQRASSTRFNMTQKPSQTEQRS